MRVFIRTYVFWFAVERVLFFLSSSDGFAQRPFQEERSKQCSKQREGSPIPPRWRHEAEQGSVRSHGCMKGPLLKIRYAEPSENVHKNDIRSEIICLAVRKCTIHTEVNHHNARLCARRTRTNIVACTNRRSRDGREDLGLRRPGNHFVMTDARKHWNT